MTSFSTKQMERKEIVLRILANNYSKFQSVLDVLISKHMEIALGTHFNVDQFIQQYREEIAARWAILLNELINQQEQSSSRYNITYADSRPSLEDVSNNISIRPGFKKPNSFDSKIYFQLIKNLRPNSGRISTKYSPKKKKHLISRKKNCALKYSNANKKEIGFCNKVIYVIEWKTSSKRLRRTLTCSDIHLLDCIFFSEVYYLVVRLFASSHYHNMPESYCDEDFVPLCLPSSYRALS